MLDGSDVSMASEMCGLCREMTDTTSTSMIDLPYPVGKKSTLVSTLEYPCTPLLYLKLCGTPCLLTICCAETFYLQAHVPSYYGIE